MFFYFALIFSSKKCNHFLENPVRNVPLKKEIRNLTFQHPIDWFKFRPRWNWELDLGLLLSREGKSAHQVKHANITLHIARVRLASPATSHELNLNNNLCGGPLFIFYYLKEFPFWRTDKMKMNLTLYEMFAVAKYFALNMNINLNCSSGKLGCVKILGQIYNFFNLRDYNSQ